MRAVVMVSGGGAISPFTTPERGCASGLSAGSTDTGMREALLARGIAVYTSPANVSDGPVAHDREANGFDGQPEQLPAELTVNATGRIDVAGEHLAAFLEFLAEREGLTDVDLLCHSMGGLFTRAALRVLQSRRHPLRVRSFITLGTPWQGSHIAEVANGFAPETLLAGDPSTLRVYEEYRTWVAFAPPDGAAVEVSIRHMMGPNGTDGWNHRQGAVLAGIPVTLVAGDALHVPGADPVAFPHDALVSAHSALAPDLPADVVTVRSRHTFPDVHSIYYADAFGLPWHRALTWNPDVVDVVVEAIRDAG